MPGFNHGKIPEQSSSGNIACTAKSLRPRLKHNVIDGASLQGKGKSLFTGKSLGARGNGSLQTIRLLEAPVDQNEHRTMCVQNSTRDGMAR